MIDTMDERGSVRDEGGAGIDRIEGGSLSRAEREFRGIAPSKVLIGAVIVVVIGIVLGWYLFHDRTSSGRTVQASAPGTAVPVPQRDAITEEQARQALMGQPAPGALGPNGLPVTPGQPGQQLPVGMTPGSPGAPGAPSGTMSQTGQHPVDPRVALDLASRRSPIMGFSQSFGGLASTPRAPVSGQPGEDANGAQPMTLPDGSLAPAAAAGGPTASAAPDGLSSQLNHHVIETAHATVVPDRAFLLSAGTLVPCTLQTAINSTQAGYVSCVIGQDVFSEDGRVVLLDKGTKVLGQYSGGINQGQARLFVLWTRALTPRGVAIDLGSPATDDLGRSGMAGGVDTLFWQRFGGALMLSVLEDLGNVASSHFANRGTQTTQVPADTAGVALQSSVNIRPILKKNQGDQVAIFVAKDFDFGGVYDVHVKR